MDFDSSSKFISSLAKFLQSLCNGYVEFDSGVHVIGHLYLSVDTGKTIDYVLNEKVCKTDENSVTFISNSFHAEPAEKPKPPGRKDDKDKQDRLERENGDGNVEQLEPRSTNYGTIPNARGSPNGKRPHSPGRVSPRSKKSRINSSEPSNLSNDNVHSPSVDGGHGQNVPQDSSYNDSYPQTFFPPADEESTTGDPERDVKPSLDTDVTFIKEEIAAESQASHDRNQFDDPYISSMFPPSNQSHPSGGFPSNFGASPSSQRTSFGPMGERHPGMLPPGQNSSQLEPGENPNDPSVSVRFSPWPQGQGGGQAKAKFKAQYVGTLSSPDISSAYFSQLTGAGQPGSSSFGPPTPGQVQQPNQPGPLGLPGAPPGPSPVGKTRYVHECECGSKFTFKSALTRHQKSCGLKKMFK